MAHKRSTVQLLLGARHQIPVPINTARLELRPFRESDIDGIAQLLADYEATRFIGGLKSRDVAVESVHTMRDAFAARGSGGPSQLFLVERATASATAAYDRLRTRQRSKSRSLCSKRAGIKVMPPRLPQPQLISRSITLGSKRSLRRYTLRTEQASVC